MDSNNGKLPSTSLRRSAEILTDQSDSGDDGDAVQESQYSINDLPVECIQKIISYLPGRHWARLELVSRKFQSGVLASWRYLNEVHLNEFSEKRLCDWDVNDDDDEDSEKQPLLSVLRMIQIRSPTIQAIDGFESFHRRLDSDIMEELAKLAMLKTVTFGGDCYFLIRDLAAFLANSRSRNVLEDLRITSGVLPGWDYQNNAHVTPMDEEAIRRALIDIEGRPGLRLKTFRYDPKNHCYPRNVLPALDASQLETLTLPFTYQYFAESEVVELLARCTQLKELSIAVKPVLDDTGSDDHPILNALKSLPSPDLRKLELRTVYRLRDEDIIGALRELAQRCPKMEALTSPENYSVEILDVIGESFSNLKELNVYVFGVSKEAFACLMIRMGQLEKLGLHSPYGERGARASIVTMALNTENLPSLHINFGCAFEFWENVVSTLDLEQVKVKELSVEFGRATEGMVAFCQRLGPIMVSVNFGTTKINDQLLVAAIGNKKMSQLRRISLKHAFITDHSLHAIGDSCPLLKELDIYGCKEVTTNGIRGLIEKCKKLTRLKVHWGIPGLREVIRDSTVTIETE